MPADTSPPAHTPTPTPAPPPAPVSPPPQSLTPAQAAPRPTPAAITDSAGVWAGVREAASSSRYLGAMLSELELESLAGGQATLIGPASIISAAQTKINDLEQLFAKITGRPIRLALRPHEPAASAEREAPRAPAADHPLVRQAIEQLGARIVAVHPRARPSGAAP